MQGSSFHIPIRPSLKQIQAQLLLTVILALVLSWSVLRAELWILPLVITLAILVLCSGAQTKDTLVLNETGAGHWQRTLEQVQLDGHSLLTPFVVALHFNSPRSGHWLLLWYDQVDTTGWRRLRRIILNCRHQGLTG